MRILRLQDLGKVNFGTFLSIQDSIWERRLAGAVPDTILFAEHPTTVSLGIRKREEQLSFLRVSQNKLIRNNIPIYKTNRGGSLTLHTPGILGCYIVMKSKNGVASVVKLFEQLAHGVFDEFGVETSTIPSPDLTDAKYHGAWTRRGKIASIGVHIARDVTRFGINFNITSSKNILSIIHPCGITEYELTTLEEEVGSVVPVRDVQKVVQQIAPNIL